jgi:hypothetical protein
MKKLGYEVHPLKVPGELVERRLREKRLPVPAGGPPSRVRTFRRGSAGRGVDDESLLR